MFIFGLGLINATHCGRENNHTLQEKSDMSRIEKHVWCDLQEAWACLIIQRGNIIRLEWASPLFECTGCGYIVSKIDYACVRSWDIWTKILFYVRKTLILISFLFPHESLHISKSSYSFRQNNSDFKNLIKMSIYPIYIIFVYECGIE